MGQAARDAPAAFNTGKGMRTRFKLSRGGIDRIHHDQSISNDDGLTNGVDPVNPLYALAHLGLGRAYAILGDSAKARTAYQDFLATWTDADSDVPVLKRAKAEYAKLQ